MKYQVFVVKYGSAAPNYSVGKKYGNVDPATNNKYLDSRIKFVLSIAANMA